MFYFLIFVYAFIFTFVIVSVFADDAKNDITRDFLSNENRYIWSRKVDEKDDRNKYFNHNVQYFTLVLTRDPNNRILVNGTSPGPALHIQLGNYVEITVVNELPNNEATTIHWHGMLQHKTPNNDGVIGMTQCPIVGTENEGKSNIMVYRFLPDSVGTYWYHGHFMEQYGDGLYGPFIVEDKVAESKAYAKAGAPYQVESDDWIFMFSDYYAAPSNSLLKDYLSPASGGDEPTPDAYMVNNKFSGGSFVVYANKKQGSVRVRFINSAPFSMVNVSVDGLPLQLIEIDDCAVDPINLSYVIVNVAQRVSFVLNWDNTHDNLSKYSSIWLRVTGIPEMYPTDDPALYNRNLYGTVTGNPLDIYWKGIISFDETLTIPSYDDSMVPILNVPAPRSTNILEATPLTLYPFQYDVAPKATMGMYVLVVFQENDQNVNLAYINGATFPPLVYNNITSPIENNVLYKIIFDKSYNISSNVKNSVNNDKHFFHHKESSFKLIEGSSTSPFILPFNEVIEVFIQNTDGGEHPFHVHGHRFWIISTSEDPFAEELYENNYIVRDVVSIPAYGWARIRFIANNPGTWLIHCHIDWHTAAGLIATMIEGSELLNLNYIDPIPISQLRACPNANIPKDLLQ